MILKGACRSNAAQAVWYLLDKERGESETVEIVELKGCLSSSPKDAAREWEALALGTKCKDHIYHLSINTRKDEPLTPDQWKKTVDEAAKNLGLENCPRLVVKHEKNGVEHEHVIFSRIDPDTGKAVIMWKNYEAHELTAREIETAFGLKHTQGRHVIEKGTKPADRGPDHDEIKQAQKTGVNLYKWRAEVRDIFQKELEEHPDANAFELVAALEAKGHILAHGDKKKDLIMILDPSGTPHRLAQSLNLKKRGGEFDEHFGDIDPADLPSIKEAQEKQAERLAEQEQRRAARKGATMYDSGSMDEQQRDALRHAKDRATGRNKARTISEILGQNEAKREKAKAGQTERKAQEQEKAKQEQTAKAKQQGRAIGKEKPEAEKKAEERKARTEQTDKKVMEQQKKAMRETFERNFGGGHSEATKERWERNRGGRER